MITFNRIRITSFNCRSLKSSIDEIRELCQISEIILLQETWLLGIDEPILNQISTDFYGQGVSAVDPHNAIISVRLFGGLAILWRKSLGGKCKLVKFDDEKRILGLEMNVDGKAQLILNVYLPYCKAENHDDFIMYLAKLDSIVSQSNTPYVYIIGDFNADICNRTKHRFGEDLYTFIEEEGLVASDLHFLPTKTYTCYSEAHGSTSWLDHIVCTQSAHALIKEISVLNNFVTSDHLPISVELVTNTANSETIDDGEKGHEVKICWDTLSTDDLAKYKELTHQRLKLVEFDHDLAMCQDEQCKDQMHITSIDNLYSSIIDALTEASSSLTQPAPNRPKGQQIPGWNDCCRESHSTAREAFILWRVNGSTKQGFFFDNMKRTRAQFKYTLRQCRMDKDANIADSLAKNVSLKVQNLSGQKLRNILIIILKLVQNQ